MDRVDGQHHLGQVELGHLLRQPVLKLTEQRQQIAAHVVVHDQILARQGDRQVRFNYGFVSFMCMGFFWSKPYHYCRFAQRWQAPKRLSAFEGFPKNRCLDGHLCVFLEPWGVSRAKHLLWECGIWNDRQSWHLNPGSKGEVSLSRFERERRRAASSRSQSLRGRKDSLRPVCRLQSHSFGLLHKCFFLCVLTSVAQFPSILSRVVFCGREVNVLVSVWQHTSYMQRWCRFP